METLTHFLASFLQAWLYHWGWLWMLIGLCGYVVVVVSISD